MYPFLSIVNTKLAIMPTLPTLCVCEKIECLLILMGKVSYLKGRIGIHMAIYGTPVQKHRYQIVLDQYVFKLNALWT